MRFRQYEDNTATLKEWARQLNVANKGTYPLYPTSNPGISSGFKCVSRIITLISSG